jgi:hypothetical protein
MSTTFVARTMSKKELREAYGITTFVWRGWVRALPADIRELIPPTQAQLKPAVVRRLLEQWGEP